MITCTAFMKSGDVVGDRPEYPAEEMDKADIVENYENVTSKCDDTSLMVCLSFEMLLSGLY